MRRLLALLMLCAMPLAGAQPEKTLTLAEAEELAVRQNPRIGSASLLGQAVGSQIKQVKSALYPTVVGNLTSVGAEQDAAVAAGAVTTSALSSRAASGLVVNQLITDFGRTNQLAESARLRAAAQGQQVVLTKAQVLLQVEQAYYQTLAAQAVLRVAQANVDIRRLTQRQVSVLAANSLKSTLDVSFAEVAVSEAELALYQAENDAQASHARLSAAMGYEKDEPYVLLDEPLPGALESDPEALIAKARADRPDLASTALSRDAAQRFAEGEKRLRYPSISAVAVAGGIPVHDQRLIGSYSGAGINVSIPFLNGKLYSSRSEEAEFRARAADKDVQTLSVQIARDVRVAWLDANNAFRKLAVTNRLVEQSAQGLRLAQARYDLGLSGILELTQAQLSQTTAQISAASAKYEYLSRRAALDYAVGALR